MSDIHSSAGHACCADHGPFGRSTWPRAISPLYGKRKRVNLPTREHPVEYSKGVNGLYAHSGYLVEELDLGGLRLPRRKGRPHGFLTARSLL